MLPEWFVPAPAGLFPKVDPYESGQQGSRWRKALTMWWDRPPTVTCKTGYACVAILDHEGQPTGRWKVGLHPKYSKEGLQSEADACEQEWESFLAQAEKYWGEPLALVPESKPYIVNTTFGTCTCEDYKRRKASCHHYLGVVYGLTMVEHAISPVTGRVTFNIGK